MRKGFYSLRQVELYSKHGMYIVHPIQFTSSLHQVKLEIIQRQIRYLKETMTFPLIPLLLNWDALCNVFILAFFFI